MPSPKTPAIVSSLLSPSRERHRLLVLAVGSLLIFAAGIEVNQISD